MPRGEDKTMRMRALTACLLAGLLFVTHGCQRPDPGLLYSEAVTAAATGNWRAALDLLERCQDVAPDDVSVKVLHGFCLFEMRRTADSLDVLEQAATAAPGDFNAQFFYGWILSECGRYGDAIGPLMQAYDQRRDHQAVLPDVLVLLSRCCLEQNLVEGTGYLQALRRYRAFDRAPEVYNALGIMYLRQGDYDNACASLLTALEKDDGNAVVLQNLAVLHDQYLQKPKEAMRYYRDSLQACQLINDSTRQAAVRNRLRQLAQQRLKPTDGGGDAD